MKTNKRGRLFVMSGPSGTGKGTICKELINRENIYLSVSNTTRKIGPNETEGVTYYYVSTEEFERMIKDGEMLEYAQYNGNYYGTNKKRVADALDAGKDVMLEIEPQGALQVKHIFSDAVLIFVLPPSMEELRKRLVERGRESIEVIEKRIAAAEWEIQQSDKYDYKVINDDLEECVKEVIGIVNKERI